MWRALYLRHTSGRVYRYRVYLLKARLRILQTASDKLTVLGQFQFWTSPSKVWQIPSFRRAFPLWFSQGRGLKSSKDYYAFVGEWSHVLNEVTSFRGKYPGEIDRCFWGALGEQNFLCKALQSRFKSFMLWGEELSPSDGSLSRCYDTINASGDHLATVRLLNS